MKELIHRFMPLVRGSFWCHLLLASFPCFDPGGYLGGVLFGQSSVIRSEEQQLEIVIYPLIDTIEVLPGNTKEIF